MGSLLEFLGRWDVEVWGVEGGGMRVRRSNVKCV